MSKNEEVNKGKGWEEVYWESHKYNERVKLKSGTYLYAVCPFCSKELTSQNKLMIEIVNPDGEVGELAISPYLNVYEHKTELHLPEGKEVKDIRCPFCHDSIIREDVKCSLCGSPAATFLIKLSNSKVPFNICSRVGCVWHSISQEDENKIILEDSDEW